MSYDLDYSELVEFIEANNTVKCETDDEAHELICILRSLGFNIGFDTAEWIDKQHTRFFSFGTFSNSDVIHTCVNRKFRTDGVVQNFSYFKDGFDCLPDIDELPPISDLLGF